MRIPIYCILKDALRALQVREPTRPKFKRPLRPRFRRPSHFLVLSATCRAEKGSLRFFGRVRQKTPSLPTLSDLIF